MIGSAVPSNAPFAHLHAAFLTLVPILKRQASFIFRYIDCPDTRENAITETIGLGWKWFVGLAERGKDARDFPVAFATLAARSVKSGRGVCGQESSKDVHSHLARKRRGFQVERLQERGLDDDIGWQQALHDNTATPVPDQVVFRLDFPAWLSRLSDREERIAKQMAIGEKTSCLAKKFGLSWGRISQLRHELHDDWNEFQGDEFKDEQLATSAA